MAMYSDTFNGDHLPWGVHYLYSVENIQIPQDNQYFVTVVYQTQDISLPKDKWLYYWMHHHPALVSLQSQVNFREMSVQDPAYQSYFGQAMPTPPGIIVTTPPLPGDGYAGHIIYSAYGQYLSTDPNVMAKELEFSFAKAQQEYPTVVPPAPIIKPDVGPAGVDITPNTIVLVLGALVLLFLALSGRRR